MDKIELLAPAGSIEALKAAVENGANAVYLGGKLFNARQSANNFSSEDLKEAVAFAHERDVKIFVTLNILLANEEIDEFIDYIYELAEAQIDAFIVQDLGVANLIRNCLPTIPLHASTQMAIHNSEGIKYLEKMGFDRVVLAREVSFENIKLIREETDVELETFVHGALCVAYSGQCLMSSMIGGRSGNRGRCAQPCRLKYSLMDRKKNISLPTEGEHLLSTKDIKMIEHIPSLIESGIRSLKIEGRMKRPEYVATVVKNYRKAIDAYYENPSNFEVTQKEEKELEQIFNREFTTAYYFGNQGKDLMSYKRPNNRGLLLGRITSVNGNKVKIKLKEPLNVGDGYEIWVTKGGRIAGKITEIFVNQHRIEKAISEQEVEIIIKTGTPRVGDRIFKTLDVELMSTALESYSSSKEIRKINLSLNIEIKEGQGVKVHAEDEEGYTVDVSGEHIIEKAIKHAITEDVLWKQFERLGNTPFMLTELKANIEDGLMVPVSELNKIRRELVKHLLKFRNNKHEKQIPSFAEYEQNVNDFIVSIPPQEESYSKTRLSIVVGDSECLRAAADEGIDQIYVNWQGLKNHKSFSFGSIEKDIDYCHKKGSKVMLRPPRIVQQIDLKQQFEVMSKLKNYSFDGVLVGNIGMLELVKEQGFENILADYPLNIFNDLTLKHLLDSGIVQAALSPELTLKQINNFSYKGNLPLEVIVHGNIPLMMSEYCVVGSTQGNKTREVGCKGACKNNVYGLKDRMNFVFPLEMDEKCHMLVYNSKALNLYKDLSDIIASGVDVLRIEARKEDAKWVRKVSKIYREAVDKWFKNQGILEPEKNKIKELETLEPQGYTTGHYFRGLI